jgi:glutamate racemase
VLAKGPKALVLGCTHYPALKGAIAGVAGPGIALVDSAATTALVVERRLREEGLLHSGPKLTNRFLATDAAERFARVGAGFLGTIIVPASVELVDLQ